MISQWFFDMSFNPFPYFLPSTNRILKNMFSSTFYGPTLLLIPNQEPHLLFHYFFIFIRVGFKNQEILLVMGSISFSLLEILGHKTRGIAWGIVLAWPFTLLQNDNITISWDFFQADSTKMSRHGSWCCQPEKISWYRNITIF